MNWGTKLVIALALFMALIVSFGVYMVNHDMDSLEESDYYEQGLDYDSVYQQHRNLQRYQAEPQVTVIADTLTIRFMHGDNKGVLLLRRPSDKTQDVRIPFAAVGQVYRLPVTSMKTGQWEVRLEWEADNVPYRYEQHIYLN